jgi:hypothetical protein
MTEVDMSTIATIRKSLPLLFAAMIGPLIAWQVQARMTLRTSVQPFVLETETRQLKAGHDLPVTKELSGVGADGSRFVRRPYVAENGDAYEVRQVTQVRDYATYTTHSAIRSITTLPLTAIDIEHLLDADPLCGLDASAEKSQILGIEVLKKSRAPKVDDADNEQTYELWIAPSLACTILRSKVWQYGEVIRTTETNWVRWEAPPSEFFDKPAGYAEMAPSQVVAALLKRYGGVELDSSVTAKWDERYLRRRSGSLK